MTISDQMLSAFLDAELSEAEMEQVRTALETNDELVLRLAELAEVDQWVVEYAEQIDATPIPNKLNQLADGIDSKLARDNQATTSNVVQISKWKTASQSMRKYYQVAAGIAVVVGVGIMTTLNSVETVSTEVAQVLDTAPSGSPRTLSDDSIVESQLSFASVQGQMCRQYQVTTGTNSRANIACKEAGEWQLKAQGAVSYIEPQAAYQAASNQNDLDTEIDKLIDGPAFDRAQEQAAINNNWH
ncbi:hypothetical protein L0668_14830 [Paraglaciecola aquimarina]|uniref:Anti-sigma factor n=1 Tax=Paraglaciecola algarum TaxID=3050085 RepID=A0ABS9D8T8_9ALTE|nr:hypothetical protein [Paraglaciecola sp. G1-23]MCF2949392.1 hypothetical protein [Paraglaciecola sp. G1-23]